MARHTSGGKRWCVTSAELVGIDEVKARDLLVECFYCAQHQTFQRAKEQIGLSWDERSVRRSVNGAVRVAFRRVGAEWDSPTRPGLEAVLQELADKSSTWGTPEEVIDHHRKEMGKVLNRLPRSS